MAQEISLTMEKFEICGGIEWKNTWEPMSHLTPASQNDALKLPLPEPKHKGGKRAKQ